MFGLASQDPPTVAQPCCPGPVVAQYFMEANREKGRAWATTVSFSAHSSGQVFHKIPVPHHLPVMPWVGAELLGVSLAPSWVDSTTHDTGPSSALSSVKSAPPAPSLGVLLVQTAESLQPAPAAGSLHCWQRLSCGTMKTHLLGFVTFPSFHFG